MPRGIRRDGAATSPQMAADGGTSRRIKNSRTNRIAICGKQQLCKEAPFDSSAFGQERRSAVEEKYETCSVAAC